MKLLLKRRLWTFIFLLFVTACVAGCTSLQKKAEELMDQKIYDEAEKIYAQILKNDPQNVDALVGLRKAREGNISRKLIEVRHHRLGGNSQQAEEELLEILDYLKTTNVYPTGPVAFTQNEELDFAVEDINESSRQALWADQPFKVALLLDRYHPLFQTKHAGLLDSLHAQANVEGLKHCHDRLKAAAENLTFLREQLARECVFWGDHSAAVKKQITHGLYGRFSITGKIQALPAPLQVAFDNDAQKVFTESPWFEAIGTASLTVGFVGRYHFETGTRAVTLTHAYEELEPYQSYEAVTKHRSVHVSVTSYVPDGKGGVVAQSNTQYQDETYTEMENVTRTRTVTKSFDYAGVQTEQNIFLESAISGRIRDHDASLTASVSDRNLTVESMSDSPSVGLHARVASIKNENEWFTELLKKWHMQNLTQLRDLWVKTYCTPFAANADYASQANAVYRCLRERSRPAPAPIDAWLTTHEGIAAADMALLLSREKHK